MKNVLVTIMLSGLLFGCADAVHPKKTVVYGPAQVAEREARLERLMAKTKDSVDAKTYEAMMTSWQARQKSKVAVSNQVSGYGTADANEYYRLQCEYLDALIKMMNVASGSKE